MKYRLLVDMEAIAVLDSLPRRLRARVLDHFVAMRDLPDRYSEGHTQDINGRRVEISIFGGLVIHYWIDFADRHVKILRIEAADRQ